MNDASRPMKSRRARRFSGVSGPTKHTGSWASRERESATSSVTRKLRCSKTDSPLLSPGDSVWRADTRDRQPVAGCRLRPGEAPSTAVAEPVTELSENRRAVISFEIHFHRMVTTARRDLELHPSTMPPDVRFGQVPAGIEGEHRPKRGQPEHGQGIPKRLGNEEAWGHLRKVACNCLARFGGCRESHPAHLLRHCFYRSFRK